MEKNLLVILFCAYFIFSLLIYIFCYCLRLYKKNKISSNHDKLISLVKKFVSISVLMRINVYFQGNNMETKIDRFNDISSLTITETQIIRFYNRKYKNSFILSADPTYYNNNPIVHDNEDEQEDTNNFFKSFKQSLCTNYFYQTNNYKFYQQLMTKTNLELYFNVMGVEMNLAQQYLTYDSKILFFKEFCLKNYIPSDISNSIVKILIHIFDKPVMCIK